MKRMFCTILISVFSLLTMSCDEEALAALAGSVSGCMLADASNFSSSALIACTSGTGCEGDNAGQANCCCEEINYGCAVSTAFNYNADAKKCAPCVSGTITDTAEDCCCEASVTGCTNSAATNYDSKANIACTDCCTYNSTADGSVFGCTDDTACNYIIAATLDCSQNAISDSSNTNCCGYATNTTCYYDGNGNGFYESDTTLTSGVCNCGLSLGGGWKNQDQVSDDIEKQGCMQPTCPEYNALANVEPQGACCNEIDGFEVDTTTTMYSLLGSYEVTFTEGNLMNNECMADSEEDYEEDFMDGEPDTDIIILGYGGEFQHYVEYSHVFSGWEIVDYETDPTDSGPTETFDGCETAAQNAGQDWFMCQNFFGGNDEENMGCWEINDSQTCVARSDCHWETRFCHFDFQGEGVPCHMLDTSGGTASECAMEPGCKIDDMWSQPPGDVTATAPCMEDMGFIDPWEECEDLTVNACTSNPNCAIKTFGGEGGGDEGTPWCLDDCPAFNSLKICDGKSQADCTTTTVCEWDNDPDDNSTTTGGICDAKIETVCNFVNGINMSGNYGCVEDCHMEILNQFYALSSGCSMCIGEYAVWDTSWATDQDGDLDVDLDDCFEMYSYDEPPDEDPGGTTGDETWTECVPMNMEFCHGLVTQATCEQETHPNTMENKCQWIEFTEFDMNSPDYGQIIQECEPKFANTGNTGGETTATNCHSMDETTCQAANNGCEWNLNPMDPSGGHCNPEMVHCENYNSESTCENTDECFWDIPPEFWGQTGGCLQMDECAMYHNESDCFSHYTDKGCEWGDGFGEDPHGCFTAQNNEFCDCVLEIRDASTCTAAGGTWGKPDWADQWEDIQICNVAFTEDLCYEMEEFVINDPCAVDFENMGFNQYIDWYESETECEVTFTEAEAGKWEISSVEELCFFFEKREDEEIICSEQFDEEECYCGDCNWVSGAFGQPDQCVSMQQGNPRMKKQYRLAYNKAINQLASDPDDEELECMPFMVDSNGNIKIEMIEPDYGFCQIIKLTKIQYN